MVYRTTTDALKIISFGSSGFFDRAASTLPLLGKANRGVLYIRLRGHGSMVATAYLALHFL